MLVFELKMALRGTIGSAGISWSSYEAVYNSLKTKKDKGTKMGSSLWNSQKLNLD